MYAQLMQSDLIDLLLFWNSSKKNIYNNSHV